MVKTRLNKNENKKFEIFWSVQQGNDKNSSKKDFFLKFLYVQKEYGHVRER